VPASGQGCLALTTRAGEELLVAGARDDGAERALLAERAFVRALGADCETPVGAYARPAGTGLFLTAFAGAEDGSAWVRDELAGDEPEALGGEVARRLLAAGADEVLGR
jgi:hydroxymethylbilane synthase